MYVFPLLSKANGSTGVRYFKNQTFSERELYFDKFNSTPSSFNIQSEVHTSTAQEEDETLID